jgi:hypothetical protein
MKRFQRILLLLLVPLPAAFPQGSVAIINGDVTDAQGAAVSGATVTATQVATGEHFGVKTNSSGFYSIPNLSVGGYSVTIEQTGFRRYLHDNITLTTGEVLGLDARLELGAVSPCLVTSTGRPTI